MEEGKKKPILIRGGRGGIYERDPISIKFRQEGRRGKEGFPGRRLLFHRGGGELREGKLFTGAGKKPEREIF